MTSNFSQPTVLRRDDRRITDRATIEEILHQTEVGQLGLAVDNLPYVVPLNFVYYRGALYFHSSSEGRKIDMIKANPQVCFAVNEYYGTVRSNKPVPHTSHYASVIVFGQARIITDPAFKLEILQALLDKYAPGRHYRALRLPEVEDVIVVEIGLEAVTAKARAPFYPGDRVRLLPAGEPDEGLGSGSFEVEAVDAEGLVHLKGSDVRLPWARFELYFGPGKEQELK